MTNKEPRIKYFYLRRYGIRKSEIVGCCAYREVDQHIEYAVSALNTRHDRFNRSEARKIAVLRLNKTSAEVEPVEIKTEKLRSSVWTRIKKTFSFVKDQLPEVKFRPRNHKFETRRVIDSSESSPYRRILRDIASLNGDECPTNLKKSARRTLRHYEAEDKRLKKPLNIAEPSNERAA